MNEREEEEQRSKKAQPTHKNKHLDRKVIQLCERKMVKSEN